MGQTIWETKVPPLAIIQLAFRRSYILFGEECLSVKDSRDVIIPKTFEFEGFRFDLNAIICHHGEEASSCHFTCFVNHGDAGFYHHNDDISTKVNIDQCLPHVYGGPGQTSYRDAHVKTSLRVVFLGYFDSKWCCFLSNYRIGTFDTAFES